MTMAMAMTWITGAVVVVEVAVEALSVLITHGSGDFQLACQQAHH